MKFLRLSAALVCLAVLAVAVQLVDPPPDSPARQFERLPDANLLTQAELAPLPASLFLADYIIENNLPRRVDALGLRQRLLVPGGSAEARLQTAGWSSWAAAGSAYDNLAGNSLADSLQYGELAEVARQLLAAPTEFDIALNKLRPLASVLPPAAVTLNLAQLGKRTGTLTEAMTRQLRSLADGTAEPTSAAVVEQFRQHYLPLLELARRCRTWSEWHTIVQQADSADQVRVLTKMVASGPVAAKQLSQVLVVAGLGNRAAVAGTLDCLLRQGPAALETLHASLRKGPAGLKLVTENSDLTAAALRSSSPAPSSWLTKAQRRYQALRYEHGPLVPAAKYLLIAIAAGLIVLALVPARYFARLVPVENEEPTPLYVILSALAVGVVLSGLAYVFARGSVEPATAAALHPAAATGEAIKSGVNPLLSGAVVLLSLLTHAVVWFWVRGKLKALEDDELSAPTLRLKRLENLDVFLDLPLFCGLALTVIAFILITLDAGMSRHFAYTSTVVGILSAVSLRIRYQYPLKERLLGS